MSINTLHKGDDGDDDDGNNNNNNNNNNMADARIREKSDTSAIASYVLNI